MQNAFNFNNNLKENGIILALKQNEMNLNSICFDCSFMIIHYKKKIYFIQVNHYILLILWK